MVSFAERMKGIKASDIRQLLAVASKPEIISFAGGLPAPELFPVDKRSLITLQYKRLSGDNFLYTEKEDRYEG